VGNVSVTVHVTVRTE